jgi:hypothetical protein
MVTHGCKQFHINRFMEVPMTSRYALWLGTGLMLMPVAHAAEKLSDAEVAGGFAFGFGMIMLIIALAVCFNALFIFMAARIVGLNGTFGTAITAVIWNFVLTIAFGILMVFLGPKLQGVHGMQWGMTLGTATLAIKIAYSGEFLKSFLTAVLSWILTIAVVLSFAYLVLGMFH